MANVAPSAVNGGGGVDPGFLSGLKKTPGSQEWHWEGPRQTLSPKNTSTYNLSTLPVAKTKHHQLQMSFRNGSGHHHPPLSISPNQKSL